MLNKIFIIAKYMEGNFKFHFSTDDILTWDNANYISLAESI